MTGVWTSRFWMRYLPCGWARQNGNPRRPDGCSDLPITVFWKEIRSLSNTESRPNVLLKRPDGCKLEQFEASRHSGRSGRKVLVVRTDDALDSWASGRYDTSSGRLVGNRIFWLVNCAKSSGSTLNSRIPVKKHHYKEVILSNRMWPITN